ncbi:hypothetical protein FRX31_011374 [Thalictrum thalictroides]|uniref:Uncharacterized protein n=1 Tax=Thalictrum thalictroides TaxID=46969 RepID=A0A7J6WQZ9_THATH|nr:hypothetical protein FRX31_011374 [Thalictrum thalictroides]
MSDEQELTHRMMEGANELNIVHKRILSSVKALKISKFDNKTLTEDVCSICLDSFLNGLEVQMLPCSVAHICFTKTAFLNGLRRELIVLYVNFQGVCSSGCEPISAKLFFSVQC